MKLFFQDEARFGRINKTSRCWVPKGQRATVSQQIVREFIYAFTAVCPETGENYSLILPKVNTEAMNMFLKCISDHYKNYRIIMAMDKAGWHRSKDLKVSDNMVLMYLPPYAPELNPTETIWNYIRETKEFNNHLFNSLDEVEEKLSKALFDINKDEKTINSLCNFKWIDCAIR